MELKELERIVPLHKKAYALLLWLKEQARRRPALLSTENIEMLGHGNECVEWIAQHFDKFPQELRPTRLELRAFAHLFSSFFSTSFRVGELRSWDDVGRTLVVG